MRLIYGENEVNMYWVGLLSKGYELIFMLFAGSEPRHAGRYKITDPKSLEAAMDAAGRICIRLQAMLSAGPSLCNIRRHGENRCWHDGVCVVSGNFVAAKVSDIILTYKSFMISISLTYFMVIFVD